MTSGCACQRLNQIESELRSRARSQQLQDELREIRAGIGPMAIVEELAAVRISSEIVPLALLEKEAILRAVDKKGVLVAAKLLGIGKTTLYRKLHEYGWTVGLGLAPRESDREAA